MKRINATYAELARLARQHPFFADYAEPDLVRHLEFLNADRCTYEKGEVIFRMGDPASRVGLILGGVIHSCVEMPDGVRCVMQTMTRGYLVGGMILIVPQERHLCTLEVVEPCDVITFSAARAVSWRKASDSGCFMRAVDVQQFKFASAMTRKCMILSQPTVEKRILAFLGMQCRDEKSQTVTIPGTEADFASYLGAHPVTVSRALNKLRGAGKISYNRNVLTLLSPLPN